MNFYLVLIFNFSIILPGILALILFRKIEERFYPFIFCLWIGCCNEILSFYFMMTHQHSLANSNIYVLIEAILLTWFFKTTGVLNQRWFLRLIVLLISIWIFENFIFGNINLNSTYFRIFASILIVILSIQLLGRVIFRFKGKLLKNSEFLLCSGFIIYFSFKSLLQSFAVYAWTRDLDFLTKVYTFMLYINFGVNLLYIPTVLWMPRKMPSLSPSS